MTRRELVLLVDDNRAMTDGLSLLLEQPGRTTIVCSDVESAEVMLTRNAITHLITDVQFTGQFGFEGLHFLGRIRSKNRQCRIVVITGNPSDALRAEVLHQGADVMLEKPFSIGEIEAALGTRSDPADGRYEITRVASIEEILAGESLAIAFQPIVRVGSGGPFAFEALARMPAGWPADVPALFDYASRRGLLRELNLLALARAIESAAELPSTANVFINLDPAAFTSDLPRFILRAAQCAGVSPDRLVLEITERTEFADPLAAAPIFDALHAQGVRFALDDHGSAYSHLAIIDRIRPSFIKISNTFGTGLEADETHRRIVTHVAWLARDFGCQTVLEGIESAETARVAEALGIELAQGYHFGRPATAASWCSAA